MLVNLYVDALLADEALADQVWEQWNAGLITDEMVALAWRNLVILMSDRQICEDT